MVPLKFRWSDCDANESHYPDDYIRELLIWTFSSVHIKTFSDKGACHTNQ